MKVKLSVPFFDGDNLFPANEVVDFPDKYKDCLPRGTVVVENVDVEEPKVDNANKKQNHKDFTKR